MRWATVGHNRHVMGRKERGPFRGGAGNMSWAGKRGGHFVGELGPHLTQHGLRRGLSPYQVASSSIQPFNHDRHGPKIRGCTPFSGGAGSPSTQCGPGPRLTSVPSGIFIHPAVWPQQTWTENWGLCPVGGRGLSPHLTQCRLG